MEAGRHRGRLTWPRILVQGDARFGIGRRRSSCSLLGNGGPRQHDHGAKRAVGKRRLGVFGVSCRYSIRACVLEKPGSIEDRPLKYTEVDLPARGSSEIRVRVTACGVRRTDLHVVDSHGGQHVSVAKANDALFALQKDGRRVAEIVTL